MMFSCPVHTVSVLCAIMVLGGLTACELTKSHPLHMEDGRWVITEHTGGTIISDMDMMSDSHHDNRQVWIIGRCMSACTMWLTYSNLCVGRDASFHFHGVRDLVGNLSDRGNQYMKTLYPPEIVEFVNSTNAMDSLEIWKTIEGDEIRKLYPRTKCD